MNPAIKNEMAEMMKGKKLLFMIIITYEKMLVNPVEYFEELALYPEWIEKSKLLFTWSAKKILEEDDKWDIMSCLVRSYTKTLFFSNLVLQF